MWGRGSGGSQVRLRLWGIPGEAEARGEGGVPGDTEALGGSHVRPRLGGGSPGEAEALGESQVTPRLCTIPGESEALGVSHVRPRLWGIPGETEALGDPRWCWGSGGGVPGDTEALGGSQVRPRLWGGIPGEAEALHNPRWVRGSGGIPCEAEAVGGIPCEAESGLREGAIYPLAGWLAGWLACWAVMEEPRKQIHIHPSVPSSWHNQVGSEADTNIFWLVGVFFSLWCQTHQYITVDLMRLPQPIWTSGGRVVYQVSTYDIGRKRQSIYPEELLSVRVRDQE